MKYLDYASTTPLSDTVRSEMKPYLENDFGNASSVHTYGRDARMAIERARQQVASVLHAQQKEIIFTSSATESNNLAIKGVVESVRENIAEDQRNATVLEVIASPIEHPCVMESLRHLERVGWIVVRWLPIDQYGMVHADDVANAISPNTVLVSVMYVNNEIGTVMPIAKIGEVVRHEKKLRESISNSFPIYFHSDAVQAVQFYDCNVDELHVDMMTLSAHKVYGPKGVGILYLRDKVSVARQIDGGGQEYYHRAGTENVAGIVGAGVALSAISIAYESARLHTLQSNLIEKIVGVIPDIILTGHPTERAPHITSFMVKNTDPEALIIALDREGFAVSSGSACSSGVVKQSHVIQALNLDVPKKSAALRISLGLTSTETDVDDFVACLASTIRHLRELNI